jgi:N-methylhydantoinase B
VPHPGSNNANSPVEVIESEYPIRVEQYGLVPDTGGAGQHRGALAQVRRIRLLESDAVLQIRSDKRQFPPFGLHGGKSGTPSSNIPNPDDEARELPTMGMTPVTAGDVLRHTMAGGGGWGDPLERDPAMVLADVRDETLSVEWAREAYSVVIDPNTLTVDEAATEQYRIERRADQDTPPT